MKELLKFATSLGDDGRNGLIAVLAVLLGLSLWALWQIAKENRRIQNDRLKEVREDTKLIGDTLNEVTVAVHEFKNSNESLRIAFETFIRTWRQ